MECGGDLFKQEKAATKSGDMEQLREVVAEPEQMTNEVRRRGHKEPSRSALAPAKKAKLAARHVMPGVAVPERPFLTAVGAYSYVRMCGVWRENEHRISYKRDSQIAQTTIHILRGKDLFEGVEMDEVLAPA